MAVSGAKVPAVVASSIVFLLLGAGLGAVGMYYFADEVKSYLKQKPTSEGAPVGAKDKDTMMALLMGKGGPGGKGGPKGGGPKGQLITLVTKVDLLTEKPLTIRLDQKQKDGLNEQLKALQGMEKVSDEEAGKILNALVEILKDHKDALVSVGFTWPGDQKGFGGKKEGAGETSPNPFTEGPMLEHMDALRSRLK